MENVYEYPYKDQEDFLKKNIMFKNGLDKLNEKYENNNFDNLVPNSMKKIN